MWKKFLNVEEYFRSSSRIEQIKPDIVLFCDDNFGRDIDRIEKICDLIIERKIKKFIGCETRIEIAKRPDLLGKMKRAGFWGLSFGLKSCRDKTLRRMKKGFTIQDVRKAFKMLRPFNFFYKDRLPRLEFCGQTR